MHRGQGIRLAVLALVFGARVWGAPDTAPVRIDLFGEPGCAECAHVKTRVLPSLEARYGGRYALIDRDLNETSNFVALVEVEERFGRHANAPVYLLIDNRFLLAGVAEIESGATRALDAALAARQSGASPPAPAEPSSDAVRRRYDRFTLGAVILAGLADGVNICAITTLVFFMSLLAQAKASLRTRLVLGLAFAGASYVTYFLIGLGLLQALHAMRDFARVRLAIEAVTVAALIVLALLSFRDAWRYGRTGRAAEVSLQLPDGIKQRIHGVMRRSVTSARVFWAGLTAGALVTVLEGVCTGQTYGPTLVLMGFEGRHGAWGLLVLYNALFILPLLAVLALVCLGLKIESLTAWTRRHVVPSKLLLGGVFLLLAALLATLRRWI